MIIGELTHDDIVQVIEHLQAACACREDCIDCPYADDIVNCMINHIPAEWRPEAIRKVGDKDD